MQEGVDLLMYAIDTEGLKVGTAIEARYGGKTKWYKGKISRVNSNGTYDVLYSDGDKERGVKRHLIRKVGQPADSDAGSGSDDGNMLKALLARGADPNSKNTASTRIDRVYKSAKEGGGKCFNALHG